MKNTLIIDIDTSLEYPIQIGKPDGVPMPTNETETAAMVKVDIDCLSEALLTLIHMASINKYDSKENMVNLVMEKLTRYLTNPNGH